MNRYTFVLDVLTVGSFESAEKQDARELAVEIALCLARFGVAVERIKPVAFRSVPPDLDAETGKEIPHGR